MFFRIVSFYTICFALLLQTFTVVQAQSDSNSQVIPQNFDTQQFENLEKKYFFLLEQYRNEEQNFLVAKNQYFQLNTLASQELAVQEGRNLLNTRADILITYLNILDQLLNKTRGIPIENKNPQLVSLSLLREQVLLHKSRNSVALDRLSFDSEAKSFEPSLTQIEENAYYTLSLIRVGQMQEAFDKLIVVRNAVEQSLLEKNLTDSQSALVGRGFDEIDRNISDTSTKLSILKNEVTRNPGKSNLSEFNSLSTELTKVYASMSQIIQFLQEIRK